MFIRLMTKKYNFINIVKNAEPPLPEFCWNFA